MNMTTPENRITKSLLAGGPPAPPGPSSPLRSGGSASAWDAMVAMTGIGQFIAPRNMVTGLGDDFFGRVTHMIAVALVALILSFLVMTLMDTLFCLTDADVWIRVDMDLSCVARNIKHCSSSSI